MAIRARFKGPTDEAGLPVSYLEGIPARNLSDEEYDALSPEQKQVVRSSELYDVGPSPATRKGGSD